MDGVHYATNGEIVFGTIQVPESAGIPLERTAYQAYRRLLAHMNMLGYPHLLRMWNYFPRINKDADGMERYRRFCLGRYEAMAECLPDFPGTVPAGTAIGTLAGPLTVYFLASRMPGQHLENPRQVNAYDYPQCYGPRSPSFARATLRVLSSESLLFISGTASVVGHASCHINDPHRQTRQILLNLDAVIRAADRLAPISEAYSGQAMFKVYLRQPEHVLTVADLLSQKLPPNSRVIYLQGDICRGDLLVEVEAILNHQRHEADVRRTSVSMPGITPESQHLSTIIR
jgi:chorismate lyase/3-hydroxybenzoate synthase